MIIMPTRLQTERLLLRPFVSADAPAVFAYAGDPQTTRLMDWARHEDIADSEQFVEDVIGGWEDGGDYCWGIEDLATGGIIGAIGCQFDEHGMTIGYIVARERWGQGLATEAGRAVFDAAREIDDVYRFSATCDVDNHASARVLEKLGMIREARLARWCECPNHEDDHGPRDVFMYAWTR